MKIICIEFCRKYNEASGYKFECDLKDIKEKISLFSFEKAYWCITNYKDIEEFVFNYDELDDVLLIDKS